MSERGRLLARLAGVAGITLLSGAPLLASARSVNEEGNRLYREKKYAQALKRYTEAQIEAPDSPQLHYNLGNVLFKQGEPERAREEYLRALAAADRALDPKAVYNLGNTFFSQQNYQEAVSAYQRALKLNPGDRDAKRNLELALLRLRQQKPPPRSGGDPKDQKQKSSESPESGKQGQPREAEQKSEGPSKQQRRGERESLSQEEAERILDALEEDEKANLKARLQAAKEKQEEVEKDW